MPAGLLADRWEPSPRLNNTPGHPTSVCVVKPKHARKHTSTHPQPLAFWGQRSFPSGLGANEEVIVSFKTSDDHMHGVSSLGMETLSTGCNETKAPPPTPRLLQVKSWGRGSRRVRNRRTRRFLSVLRHLGESQHLRFSDIPPLLGAVRLEKRRPPSVSGFLRCQSILTAFQPSWNLLRAAEIRQKSKASWVKSFEQKRQTDDRLENNSLLFESCGRDKTPKQPKKKSQVRSNFSHKRLNNATSAE